MFYCPIHKVTKCSSYEVESTLYNFDYDACEECSFLIGKFNPVSTWFRKSTEKVRPDLKTAIRTGPIEYYQFLQIYERFGTALKKSKHQKFTSFRYIDNLITKVQLFESEVPNYYLVSAQTQKKHLTKNVYSAEDFPIHLVRNDEYVLNFLKPTEEKKPN